MKENQKTIHFSVDDCLSIFQDISKRQMGIFQYSTPWRHPMLKKLKYFNERFGMTVTLYCMRQNDKFLLEECTERFSDEFLRNSSWLKFGFHSVSGDSSFAETAADEARASYEGVMNKLKRIGGMDNLDSILRLHYYAGNEESINALKRSEVYPLKGLLGPDDERIAYNLDHEESVRLRQDGIYYKNGIQYFRTDLRLEKSVDILKDIRKQMEKGLHIEIFTHEWMLKKEMCKLWQICREVKSFGYRWSFITVDRNGMRDV